MSLFVGVGILTSLAVIKSVSDKAKKLPKANKKHFKLKKSAKKKYTLSL